MESLALLSKVRNALRMLENGECGFDSIQREAAMRTLDYFMSGNSHFNEISARGCIAQMYYYRTDTEKAFAPYFSYDEVKNEYEKVAHLIPDYNQWDFAVTMNLVYSNHIDLVRKWSRSEDSVIHKITDLSVSFLCDEDTNHPTDKIFWYMTAG